MVERRVTSFLGGSLYRRVVPAVSLIALIMAVPGAADAGRSTPTHVGKGSGEAGWFVSQRAYPFGGIPIGSLKRARAAALSLPREVRAAPGQSATTPIAWTQLGPQATTFPGRDQFAGPPPVAGRVTAVAPDPVDPNVAYLGAADGGVWKTTDAGVTWFPLFDAEPTLAIGAVTVAPGVSTASD